MIWLFLIFRFLAWMMSVVFCHSVFVMFQTSFTEFGHLSSSMQGKNWYFVTIFFSICHDKNNFPIVNYSELKIWNHLTPLRQLKVWFRIHLKVSKLALAICQHHFFLIDEYWLFSIPRMIIIHRGSKVWSNKSKFSLNLNY